VHCLVQVNKKLSLLHRSRIDILANILQIAEGGAKKTRIMYQCNLSFRSLQAYLDFLVDVGLLDCTTLKTEEKVDSQLFKTTKKGKAFIKAYRTLRALLV
jgi:predicted transcriptional regulator